jgi:hypothetical protein
MKKISKLRVIDRGTRYDVSGKLRRLVRQIESGEIKPRDVIVLTTETVRNNAGPRIIMHHYGTGTEADMHWILATAQNRIEPA